MSLPFLNGHYVWLIKLKKVSLFITGKLAMTVLLCMHKRAIHLEQPVSICSDEQRIQITQSRH
jgi:hypothetical protein